jgi:methyl-accepting chemotaxis protein
MLNRLTLRQCFLLGFILIFFSVATTSLAIRYLGKTALLYKMERVHKVTMLEIRGALDSVKNGRAEANARDRVVTLLAKTNDISLVGLKEFFAIEIFMFHQAGFSKPFELTERDVVLNNSMQQVLKQAPGTQLDSALVDKLEPFMREQFQNSNLFGPEFDRVLAITKWAAVGLMAFSQLLMFVALILLRRRILVPLQSATRLAEKIADGDLTTDIVIRSNDEVGLFQRALKSMNENLANIAQQVRASSEGIATAANQVVAGSGQLADRTEHQASTLEQTAASMEELAATTSNSLDQMRQAKKVATAAVSAAHESGTAVTSAIEIMNRMDASSKRIADIVGLIDGIAFQTNILALNAAVEAARAGEQGRGFAVVAQEIRQLAHKSAAAAKEIKGLIEGSLTVAAESNALVGDAGNKMRTTVDRIRLLADLVNQTELASAEQFNGIQQVSQAMAQLEDVTQHNAALVEQATAAAESQERQAQYLVQLVSQFKLKNIMDSPAPVRAASRPLTNKPVDIASPAISAPRGKIGAARASQPVVAEDREDWKEF